MQYHSVHFRENPSRWNVFTQCTLYSLSVLIFCYVIYLHNGYIMEWQNYYTGLTKTSSQMNKFLCFWNIFSPFYLFAFMYMFVFKKQSGKGHTPPPSPPHRRWLCPCNYLILLFIACIWKRVLKSQCLKKIM